MESFVTEGNLTLRVPAQIPVMRGRVVLAPLHSVPPYTDDLGERGIFVHMVGANVSAEVCGCQPEARFFSSISRSCRACPVAPSFSRMSVRVVNATTT